MEVLKERMDPYPLDGRFGSYHFFGVAIKELAEDTVLRCPETGKRELHDAAAEA